MEQAAVCKQQAGTVDSWMARKVLRGGILVLACALPMIAQNEWDAEKQNLKSSCSNLFSSLQQIGSCGEFLFSSGTPVRLSVPSSVVPGGGTALGAVYSQPLHIKNWTDSNFSLQGGSSIQGFWYGDAAVTFDHKKFIQPLKGGDRFQVSVYGDAKGLPVMPFYGIGPGTSRSALADYSEDNVKAGVSVVNPITKWIDTGGTVEYFKGAIRGSQRGATPSIVSAFDEATAPGLTHQPSFAHYEVYLQPKYTWSRTSFNSRVSYEKYQDLGRGLYSFQKVRADYLQKIYLETLKEKTSGGTGTRSQPRYDSVLYIGGRFSTSGASRGSVIPFYLEETIGGSDIDSVATLRGYQDYRFRAPDLFSLQAQFERRVLPAPRPGTPRPSTFRSALGALGILAFYDAGEVATAAGGLGFSNIRHSYGFGLTFWSGEKVWFRAYIGLGSGEGTHTFFGVTSPGAQNLHL